MKDFNLSGRKLGRIVALNPGTRPAAARPF